MQAIWKGSVSFGLVTIPVKVFAVTQEKDISFRQVHAADGGRIRYRRVCDVDGEEVPYSDIAKGYELPDGEMVVLTSDELAELPLPSKRAIEVLEFVPEDQIDSIYAARSYYLEADSGVGAKPYVLLRNALKSTGQVAVVKVALRNREALALLRPVDEVLVMQTMLWPDEVRDAGFAVPTDDVEIRPQEVAMAESYIQTLSTDFEPERYHDEYREALQQLIDAKTEGREVEPATTPADTGQVVDLMAALQASVDAVKKDRGSEQRKTTSKSAVTKTSATKSGTTKTTHSGTTKKAAKKASKKAGKTAGNAAQKAETTSSDTAAEKPSSDKRRSA